MSKKSAGDVIENRKRLLAQLIDAYLAEQTPIQLIGADGELRFLHSGIKTPIHADISHVQALHSSGKVILMPGAQRSTWSITIPDSTLLELHRTDEEVFDSRPGPERQESLVQSQVFQQYFYGAVGNVAQNSPHARQTASVGLQSGDSVGLIRSLRELGLTEQGMEELRAALKIDENVAGHRTIGKHVRAFMGQVATETTGSLVADGVKTLPAIMALVHAYVG